MPTTTKTSPNQRLFTQTEAANHWSDGFQNPDYPPGILPFRYIGDVVQRLPALNDFIARMGKPDGKLVFDGGSGQGYLSEALAYHGFQVVGQEIDQKMLDQARTRLQDFATRDDVNNLSRRIKYFSGDLSHIHAEDNTFDGAIECGVAIFNSSHNLAKIFAEYFRVLKPKGILSMSTYAEYLVSPESPSLKPSAVSLDSSKVSDLIIIGSEEIVTKDGAFASTKVEEYYYHSQRLTEEIREQPPFTLFIHPENLIISLAKQAGFEVKEIVQLWVQKEHLDISPNWQGGATDYPYFKRFTLQKPSL